MRSSAWSAAAGWLAFLILPLIITAWSLGRGAVLFRSSELQDLQWQVAHEIRSIIFQATPEELARQRFKRLPNPRSSFPGKELVAFFPSRPENNEVLGRLARLISLRQLPEGSEKDLLWNQLGYTTDFKRLMVSPGIPIPARWGRDEAWLIWRPDRATEAAKPETSVPSMAVSGQAPPYGDKAGKRTVQLALLVMPSFNKRLQMALERNNHKIALNSAIVDLQRKSCYRIGGPMADRLMFSLKQRLKANESNLDQGSVFTHLELLDEKQAIYLEKPFATPSPADFSRRLAWLAGGLLLLGTLTFPLIRAWGSVLPLQMKSLGIFSLAVAMPLFGCFTLTMGLLSEREQELVRDSLKTARSEVMRLDEQFRREEVFTTTFFRQLSQTIENAGKNLGALLGVMRAHFDRGLLERAEIRDWQNNLLMRLTLGKSDEGFNLLMEAFSRLSLFNSSSPGADQKEASIQPEVFIGNSVVESAEFGFAPMLKRPGLLNEFKAGQSRLSLFWVPGKHPENPEAIGFICFSRTSQQMGRGFLANRLLGNRTLRFVAHDSLTGAWLPRVRPNQEMVAMCQSLDLSGEDQVGRFAYRSRPYMAMAVSPLHLGQFALIALVDERNLQKSLKMLKTFISWGFFLALLGGSLSALFLAETLLVPLGHLTEGMRALQQRKSLHRIPITSRDELGKTAIAFNRMIEAIHELDMAKVVQDTLIPASPSCPPGYEVFLRNHMMESIGGDYCDCFSLPDGRLILLMGDVSGHGIGAALIMTMAKTAVYYHFSEGKPVETLLDQLNETLYDLRKKGQFMTFCFGVLDPVAHTMSIALAGHPQPVVFDPCGAPAPTFPQAMYPLASKKKQTFSFTTFPLPPGGLVLLYTDGIVEALDKDENPFDYNRLIDITNAHASGGARKVVETLFKELERHAGEIPLNDDVTLLAICRKGQPVQQVPSFANVPSATATAGAAEGPKPA